jgi:hypothetical protein
MNLKELREWLNLFLTVIGVAAIGYLNLKFHDQKLEIEGEVRNAYVEKTEFRTTIGQLADSNTRQWQAIRENRDKQNQDKNDMDLKLQHLKDVVLREEKDQPTKNDQ